MEQGFIDILKTIIKDHGKEAIIETSKCKGLLSDYTKGEYKKECRLLLLSIEAKIPKEINTEIDTNISYKKSIRILIEDYGMRDEIAIEIVDTFLHVLKDIPIQKREEDSNENNKESKQKIETIQKNKRKKTKSSDLYLIMESGSETEQGPFELNELRELIKNKKIKITKKTRVKREREPAWRPMDLFWELDR